jgi:hypothetical protein
MNKYPRLLTEDGYPIAELIEKKKDAHIIWGEDVHNVPLHYDEVQVIFAQRKDSIKFQIWVSSHQSYNLPCTDLGDAIRISRIFACRDKAVLSVLRKSISDMVSRFNLHYANTLEALLEQVR